jgi:hypothetical protein
MFIVYLRTAFHDDGAWHLRVLCIGSLYNSLHWKKEHNTICEEFRGPIREIDKLSREKVSISNASSIQMWRIPREEVNQKIR